MNYSQTSSEDLEKQLAVAYTQQSLRYEAAWRVANDIATKMSSGEVELDLQEKLGSLMEEIAAADEAIEPMRQEWDESGRKANAPLRDAVERLRQTIESVIETVSHAESLAERAKTKLVPHLGTAMSARRMVSAYDAAKSSH